MLSTSKTRLDLTLAVKYVELTSIQHNPSLKKERITFISGLRVCLHKLDDKINL